ncbi:MAG: transcriptional regulator [Candidatus Magasanikbacteria bacterium RIFCSPHIGHO2_01_FULL_41_23]|uniref:Transcriptional regulator n=1 Tax=Candidatus Magasanikbacteria bacterium RIFCSPLOWO2_01_FULL_40_15 TaxID=1798686 RepID=A0A1F6N388_9BACT|nr:MAG: transcriptional regulator [Candidatus Magasanikbacteria bacterium RIFCSPHIGHO2_01_FULL_41_23]OGH66865.1 MAG: transcriptional regulator [Candidatus Magasanikbacteria bacterium RIFCSPHIGHO2_02_FULL_41_35]OGH74848.1 MAG: transcriptional regulator [Candidatus Magasanikbacteria bacterium RIFCSPHIGHO2_12_FULL_41_16]OGH78123.1 MAG: transcriptional regulator [Candidatus Magasanikbacteria bacterium RIFCSPLOWO2_01_FULL_40_15]
MKNFSTFREEQFKKKPGLREAYEALGPEYELIAQLIRKRLNKGLTQSALAKKIGTKQSAIARLESGNYNASIAFLEKVAKALDAKLVVSIL